MKFDAFIIGDLDDEKAKAFCEQFTRTLPRKDVSILLASPGGDVDSAMVIGAAIQIIQRSGLKVHIHIAGAAQSAAVAVTQFADKRTMEPFSYMLIHPHYYEVSEEKMTLSDLNGLIASIAYGEHIYFEVLQRRTGFDCQQILEKAHYRNTQVILYPADCLRWNLIDEILDYPMPRVGQETVVPTDDSLDNVVPLPQRSASEESASSRKRRSSRAKKVAR